MRTGTRTHATHLAPRPRPDPIPGLAEPVRIRTKIQAAGVALRSWRQAGFPILDRAGRKARGGACAACDFWHPLGNLGLGECRAPSCGCTRLKRWVATEKCPEGKWPI